VRDLWGKEVGFGRRLGNILISLPAVTPHGELVSGPDGELGGINAFVLTCKNCGFIRLHAEQVLSDEPHET
jgi:hypothetical protein